jgi:hypothetical protein
VHAAAIHDDAIRAATAVFDGIEEERRIQWVFPFDECLFVTHRERFEDGPPLWGVYLYRAWHSRSPLTPVGNWPVSTKLDFLTIADEFRAQYLRAIEEYETLAAARYAPHGDDT